MTQHQFPSEEQLQEDLVQIKLAFDNWKPSVSAGAPGEAPDDFIRNHWRICQYLAARNRDSACPHPDDVAIDKMNAETVSAVRISSTLLKSGATSEELIACFVAHVLGSAAMVFDSDE